MRVVVLPDAPEFTIVTASNDLLAANGLSRENIVNTSLSKASRLLRNFTAEALIQILIEVVRTKKTLSLNNGSDNQTIIATPVLGGAGDLRHIICSIEMNRLGVETAYNVFLAAPVVIGIVRGDDYVIELANNELLNVWGRGLEVIGRPLLEAIPELQGQGFKELLDEVRRTGQSYYATEAPIMLAQNGTIKPCYMNFVYKPYYEDGNGGVATGVISVGHDVTEQVKARTEIDDNRQELQLAIDVANLGMFRVDLATNTATYSDRVMQWFGFSAQNTHVNTIISHVHPEDRQRVLDALQSSFVAPEHGRHEITYRVINPVDGSERHLHSFAQTRFNKEGKPYLVTGMIQDITTTALLQQQLKNNESELQKRVRERTRELELRNDELEQFSYASHHDLQEPLRKIITFAEMITSDGYDALPPASQKRFGRIVDAARRMSRALRDILNYASMSKEELFVDINLDKVVADVITDLDHIISDKQAVLSIGELTTLKAVPHQMHQLFYNLINNALKFSRPDVSPQIKLWCEELTEKGSRHLQITVEDNGIGFDPASAEKIFGMFHRLHTKDAFEGTGIGLALCRRVVHNHGGKIWAENKAEGGAVFKILLPGNN